MAEIEREPAWQEKNRPQQLQTTEIPDKSCVFPSIYPPLSVRVGVRHVLAFTHFTGTDQHRIDLIHVALTPLKACLSKNAKRDLNSRPNPSSLAKYWWAVEASNLRPQQCECCALPLS